MKGTGISKEVREIVLERDSVDGHPCCMYCGNPYNLELAHYVSRARGGKGIPENLVTLCKQCHMNSHSGNKAIDEFMKTYLKRKYQGWEESKVILKKGIG